MAPRGVHCAAVAGFALTEYSRANVCASGGTPNTRVSIRACAVPRGTSAFSGTRHVSPFAPDRPTNSGFDSSNVTPAVAPRTTPRSVSASDSASFARSAAVSFSMPATFVAVIVVVADGTRTMLASPMTNWILAFAGALVPPGDPCDPVGAR